MLLEIAKENQLTRAEEAAMLPIVLNAVAMMFFVAGYACAAGGGEGGSVLLSHVFISFLALIVAGQIVPGLMLLGSMLRGLFSRLSRETSC